MPESGHPPYPTYQQLRDRLEHAETALAAIGGLVDEWRADGLDLDAGEANRRVRRAATELTRLLDHLNREGSWEYAHVSALESELRAVQRASWTAVMTSERPGRPDPP